MSGRVLTLTGRPLSPEPGEPPRAGGLAAGGVVRERVAAAGTVMCPAAVGDDRSGAEPVTLVEGEERLLTLEELAGRLQYSVDWVRQQVRLGRIPAIRFNARAWRFHWPTVLKALHWLN